MGLTTFIEQAVLPGDAPEQRILRAQKITVRVAALPHEQALRCNTWLRDSAWLRGEDVSAAYPAVFEIEPTNVCAMRCIHCPRPVEFSRTPRHMSPDLLADIAPQIRRYAQNLYSATGNQLLAVNLMHYGEPALAPRYGELVRLLKARGLRVVSSSTASELSEEIALAAIQSGLDELWMVFDGMDDETFKAMRGPRASFTAGIERLRFLQKAKSQAGSEAPEIMATMVRHPRNRHQWDAFQKFFGEWPGVRCYLADFSTFNGKHAHIRQVLADLGDDPATTAEQERVAALNAHVCRYPWHSMSIMADGRVVPCCRDINGDMVLGDLTRHSLVEIWNGPVMRKFRRSLAADDRKNPLCRACREASLEIGVPARLDKAAGAEVAALCKNI